MDDNVQLDANGNPQCIWSPPPAVVPQVSDASPPSAMDKIANAPAPYQPTCEEAQSPFGLWDPQVQDMNDDTRKRDAAVTARMDQQSRTEQLQQALIRKQVANQPPPDTMSATTPEQRAASDAYTKQLECQKRIMNTPDLAQIPVGQWGSICDDQDPEVPRDPPEVVESE